jgi:hypothetical protein
MQTLSDNEISQFIERGFVRIDKAFSKDLASRAREILWRDLGCSPDDPSSWIRPVVRLGMYTDTPFIEAANSERLVCAYNSLAGEGCWIAPKAMGTFPIRFPSPVDPGDIGWHVDMSIDFHKPNFLQWKINSNSDGRLLLMLFLFSDVTEKDAPTKLRVGSHLEIALQLSPHGSAGLTLGELAKNGFSETETCTEALAEGPAGTVYLCHPFIVHSAQTHRGHTPKFMAQPPLLPRPGKALRHDSPVQVAIRQAGLI